MRSKISDDIFLDKEDSEPNLMMGGESDLLGDLFSNPRAD